MKSFVTCHCHQGSLDTASTPEAFAKREVELGTGYLTVTDHGTLGQARNVYKVAQKNKLTPIIGLEAYLRDDDCPIIKSKGFDTEEYLKFGAKEKKYMHLTLHFLDQEAFETGVRLLSNADARAEKHGQEKKPLFSWSELEELGSKNVTMTSSCLIGVVQRHLLAHSNVDMAVAYYEKIRSLVKPGNFYVEVFPHVCDKNWDSAVYVVFEDGTKEKFKTWKKLKIESVKGEVTEAQAQEMSRKWNKIQAGKLLAVMENRKWQELPEAKVVKDVILQEGFVVNDCQPWAPDGDVQAGCNKFLLYQAEAYGDPILIGDDSHFATPDEKVVQDIRLQAGGGNWRFYGSYHRQSSSEAFEYFKHKLGVDEKTFEGWIDNTYAWADKFKGFKFKDRKQLPTKFYPEDTFQHTMKLIEKHGRMRWEDPDWVERLRLEIEMLHQNGHTDLLPYFFIDEEVVDFYNDKGILTGAGRGSAAGLLLAYLLRITHVPPLQYKLSMERFMTQSRIRSGKWPDIDQDLSRRHRDLLIDPENGWLKFRFGDHYAHISVDTKLKLRSSVKDVARVLHHGRVPDEIEALTKKFQNAPQGVPDSDFVFGYKNADGSWVEGSLETDSALRTYIEHYPKEWDIVKQCLGLTRQKAPHACGFVIANEPVQNFIPMTSVGDEPVTQYTAAWVEAAGGLKMDFLGLNSLDDIADCIKLIHESNAHNSACHLEDCPVRHGASVDCVVGHECNLNLCSKHQFPITEPVMIDGEKVLPHEVVPFQGKLYSIWKLPEDQAVFRDFCEGRTETVFQFNTPGALGWLENFDRVKKVENGVTYKALSSIEDLAAFTALDRPGPLDYYVETMSGDRHNMLVEYAIRASGGVRTGNLPILDKLLPETYGVIVYQEQLQRIFQHIGNTSAEAADDFRVHISKKMPKEVAEDKLVFMAGAVPMLGEEDANRLWESMETFARYGFNKSHAVSYVITSYACAFLKHHYPLQWWTSVLRNADKDEINSKFWNFCGHLIDLPDVAKSGDTFEIQGDRIRAPLTLLHGIGQTAHEQLMAYRPYLNLEGFCQAIVAHKKANETKVEKIVQEDIIGADGTPTGEVKDVVVVKTKAGHSAVNRSTVATLVVSGAMKSLFPKDLPIIDCLNMFNIELAKAQGKKKPDKVDSKYLDLNEFAVYQLKKSVLPAYHENLMSALTRHGHQLLVEGDGEREMWRHRDDKVPFATLSEIERIEQIKPFPPGSITVATIGYVMDERKFKYAGGKEAIELFIDIQGGTIKGVKWPAKKTGKLPDTFKASIKGAIVVSLFTKYDEDKPFNVEEVIVIQNPMDHKTEESPEKA